MKIVKLTRAELEKKIAVLGANPTTYHCPEDHPHESMTEALECLTLSARLLGIVYSLVTKP